MYVLSVLHLWFCCQNYRIITVVRGFMNLVPIGPLRNIPYGALPLVRQTRVALPVVRLYARLFVNPRACCRFCTFCLRLHIANLDVWDVSTRPTVLDMCGHARDAVPQRHPRHWRCGAGYTSPSTTPRTTCTAPAIPFHHLRYLPSMLAGYATTYARRCARATAPPAACRTAVAYRRGRTDHC